MCFFPQAPDGPNPYGINYKCGGCPECLAERAKYWALRCSMESVYSPSVMVTLTYDQYIRDKKGKIIGETVDRRELSKRDCQLFIKRVRKKFPDQQVKYLIAAERGTRTNRSHYHAILFNVPLSDCVPYKKSKRGNMIYLSRTLTRLWGKGICTVDCKTTSPQIVRYCTKYAAKDSRCSDSFMLFSRGIGDRALRERFNGKSYIISGREYPIPRQVWQWYIVDKYQKRYSAIRQPLSVKYVAPAKVLQKHGGFMGFADSPLFEKWLIRYPRPEDSLQHQRWRSAWLARLRYQRCRDRDPVYREYRKYWDNKIKTLEKVRPSALERVVALPNSKYWHYKQAALRVLRLNIINQGFWHLPPRSNCVKRARKPIESLPIRVKFKPVICNTPSCHNTANDTFFRSIFEKCKKSSQLDYFFS